MRLFLLFASFVVVAVYGSHSCDLKKQVQKIGCYKNSHHDMVVLIKKNVDWNNYATWFGKMMCLCVEKARKRGYDHIQISDFGECSGGANFDNAKKHREKHRADACFHHAPHWDMCDHSSNKNCVGSEDTGYIYKITGKGPGRDGGYSNWGGWTPCSVTCGEGVQGRSRACTNPIPEGHGKDCSKLGPVNEQRACNTHKTCPGAFITEVSFTSRNYREHKIGEGAHHTGWIITRSSQVFRLVGALNGRERAYSIQTLDKKRYLRHAGWYTYFHGNDGSALFKNDASFYINKNVFFKDGTVSFESCNYPGMFLRHTGYRLRLDRASRQELYKNDASFIMSTTEDKYTGLANLISQNYHHFSIGQHHNHESFIIHGRFKLQMIAGLNGRPGSVTFKLVHENRYLRHRHGLCHFDHNDGSQLFKDDASFNIIENKYYNGFVVFEASNYPGAYLRHQGYRIKLHYPQNSELFRRDASFMIARVST